MDRIAAPLPRSLVRLVCAILVLRIAALALGRVATAHAAERPWARPVVLDPNRARVHELATLPGLGPERAEAIVLERVRHGWFGSIAELERVDGIGARTVAELAPFLRIESAASPPR